MTINELDQGIRNLIASQPMVASSINGEVINGINSLIDAYRNFCFRVQSYPCQDVMKFGLSNEISKLENSFTNMAVQVLQERGINIMLYIPRTGAGYGPMVNAYGMINTVVDPNVMLGQMSYTAPVQQQPMMQMPNTMVQPGRPPMAQPAFNPMQPSMSGVGVPNFTNKSMPKRNAPTFPGYAPTDRPVNLEPSVQGDAIMKAPSAPQSKIKPEPKAVGVASINKNMPNAEISVDPSPSQAAAEMMMDSPSGKKAQGRDYLMELLKK